MLPVSKTRLISLMFFVLLGLSLIPYDILFSGNVSAQQKPEATWINQAAVDFGGQTFKDGYAMDSNWSMTEQNAKDGCPDKIEFKWNTTDGAFTTRDVKLKKQKPIVGGCTSDGETTLSLLDTPQGYNLVFRWIDSNNIESADGTKKFSKQNDVFMSITDSGTCKDYITVADNNANLILNVRSRTGGAFDNATDSLRAKYAKIGQDSGYPFDNQISSTGDVSIDGDTCHESKGKVNTTAYDTKNTEVPGTSQTSGSGPTGPTCESNNGSVIIGWLICSVINVLDSAAQTSEDIINSLLTFNAEDYTKVPPGAKDSGLHQAWSAFRVIASFSLLAVALVMIIGQAIGKD
jgi:hypothetical protein